IGPSPSRYGGRPESDEQLRGDLRGAYDVAYAIPAVAAEAVEIPSPVRLGAWRAVQHNHNVFAAECFLDELAQAAGQDPFPYRRRVLARPAEIVGGRESLPVDRARLAAVLALAAEKARWAPAPGAGRGRGIACASYDARTSAAAVADVTVNREGGWRAERIVCAVDCGAAVNPPGVARRAAGPAGPAPPAAPDRDP